MLATGFLWLPSRRSCSSNSYYILLNAIWTCVCLLRGGSQLHGTYYCEKVMVVKSVVSSLSGICGELLLPLCHVVVCIDKLQVLLKCSTETMFNCRHPIECKPKPGYTHSWVKWDSCSLAQAHRQSHNWPNGRAKDFRKRYCLLYCTKVAA